MADLRRDSRAMRNLAIEELSNVEVECGVWRSVRKYKRVSRQG